MRSNYFRRVGVSEYTNGSDNREWIPGPDDYIPEHLEWRLNAACRDSEGDLFFMGEVPEGGSAATTKNLNVEKFRHALAICRGCDVVRQCEQDAIHHGDHLYSVRGGVSPYDRDRTSTSIKPKPNPNTARPEDHPEMWNLYAGNIQRDDVWRAADMTQNAARRVLDQMIGAVTSGPQTVTWQAHRDPAHHPVKPGAGWIVSIGHAGDVACVITVARGRVTRRIRLVKQMTFIDGVTTDGLPPLLNKPALYA